MLTNFAAAVDWVPVFALKVAFFATTLRAILMIDII